MVEDPRFLSTTIESLSEEGAFFPGMNAGGTLPSSFRDPSGFLFTREGILYRQVNRSYGAFYDHLMQSGLYRELTESSWLVPHAEVDAPPLRADCAYRVIRPERIPFISHPYEWCFSQLKEAALLTLKIQRRALEAGMSLKDASASNVQFLNGKPIFIDSLSFERYSEGRPWIAYRQFCQQFLAPLALMSRRDVRLGRLLQIDPAGVPLDLADSLLPISAWLSPALFLHLHLHAKAQQRLGDQPPPKNPPRMDRRAFVGLIDHLKGAVDSLRWQPRNTTGWEAYYQQSDYGPEALEQKRRLVGQFLDQLRPPPRLTWDLGANTGLFSRMISSRGILTISIDSDAACVERNFQECVRTGEKNLLPLLIDLANPSPGLGWAHEERSSWMDRGPADLVLALALLHHLAIANNVPLQRIADLLAKAGRWLIIEFIPKEDPQVQRLLAYRDDIFPDYSREGFERCLGALFTTRRTEKIQGTERLLYLMERTS